MPSTRKQMAKEKRSRQSDVMSDMEKLDIILGDSPKEDYERHEEAGELEAGLESEELHTET